MNSLLAFDENISKILKAIALSLILWFAGGSVFARDYQYDTLATLQGVLITSKAKHESVTPDDKKPYDFFPALKLFKPISVRCTAKKTAYCETETGVTLLHLVLKEEEQMKQFKKLKGKIVKLRGTLFYWITAHHFTPVLMDVESITH